MFEPEELLKNLTKKEVTIYYYYVCKRWQHKQIAEKLKVKLNQHGYYDHWTSARDKLGITNDPEHGFNQRFCYHLSEEIINNWPDKTKSSPPGQLPIQEKPEEGNSMRTSETENRPRSSRFGIFLVVGFSVLMMAVMLFGVIFLFTGGFDRFFMGGGGAPAPSETAVLLPSETPTDTPEGLGVVVQQATPLPSDTTAPPPPLPTTTVTLTPTLTSTPTPTPTPTLTPTLTLTPIPTDTKTPIPTATRIFYGEGVLFQTYFEDGILPSDDEWDVQTTHVKPSIQNGFFIAPEDFIFNVGDDTWVNYSVTIDFEDRPCWTDIGLRDELNLNACDDRGRVWAIDIKKFLPGANFTWAGRGKYTFQVVGNKYTYFGNDIIRDGKASGRAYIKIPGSTRVRKIIVHELP